MFRALADFFYNAKYFILDHKLIVLIGLILSSTGAFWAYVYVPDMLQKTTQDSIIEQENPEEALPSQENTIVQETISGALVQETITGALVQATTESPEALTSQEENPSPENTDIPTNNTTAWESPKTEASKNTGTAKKTTQTTGVSTAQNTQVSQIQTSAAPVSVWVTPSPLVTQNPSLSEKTAIVPPIVQSIQEVSVNTPTTTVPKEVPLPQKSVVTAPQISTVLPSKVTTVTQNTSVVPTKIIPPVSTTTTTSPATTINTSTTTTTSPITNTTTTSPTTTTTTSPTTNTTTTSPTTTTTTSPTTNTTTTSPTTTTTTSPTTNTTTTSPTTTTTTSPTATTTTSPTTTTTTTSPTTTTPTTTSPTATTTTSPTTTTTTTSPTATTTTSPTTTTTTSPTTTTTTSPTTTTTTSPTTTTPTTTSPTSSTSGTTSGVSWLDGNPIESMVDEYFQNEASFDMWGGFLVPIRVVSVHSRSPIIPIPASCPVWYNLLGYNGNIFDHTTILLPYTQNGNNMTLTNENSKIDGVDYYFKIFNVNGVKIGGVIYKIGKPWINYHWTFSICVQN